jgi:hypothetical protein
MGYISEIFVQRPDEDLVCQICCDIREKPTLQRK